MHSAGAKPPSGQGDVKILVIDPKPQSRSVLKGSLRGLDLVGSVLERSSSQDLLQILRESPVHLVIVEQDLGAEDALQVVQTVLQQPMLDKPRFILISQEIAPEVRVRASAAGVKGFLTRPFDLLHLERAVREALDLRAAPAAAPSAPGVNRELLDRLRKVPLFQGFTDAELIRLLRIIQVRQFIANQYVFREGEPGDKMYVLVSGLVEIRQTRGGQEKVLVQMKPGDCFGEMAIIDSGPRSADAYVVNACMVIEVKAETIHQDDDWIALKMVRQLAILLTQKIRRMSQ
ncbi:MAG: cyclic nucleotide-binding domain-containing protein [SAR324 cluster bacterium]